MKKLLLVAAFGIAGILSANSSVKIKTYKFEKNYQIQGTCEIKIYRNNSDGSQTLVYQETSNQPSAAACEARLEKLTKLAAAEGW